MNVFTFSGRLAAEPEVKQFGETTVTKLYVANNEHKKDKEITSFFRCVLFGKMAETAGRMMHKGTPVIISGRIEQQKYTANDGTAKESYEVVVDNWDFAGPPPGGNGNGGSEGYVPQARGRQDAPPRSYAPAPERRRAPAAETVRYDAPPPHSDRDAPPPHSDRDAPLPDDSDLPF